MKKKKKIKQLIDKTIIELYYLGIIWGILYKKMKKNFFIL